MTREPAAIARRVQEALETAKLSFALAGVVLFGSSATARAAAHSDVDLLVVGRGLSLKRQRRCREIVEIKQWLPGGGAFLWKDPLLEAARISEELEPEVSLSRYPGINLQRDDNKAKVYQVRQVRAIILKYKLGGQE